MSPALTPRRCYICGRGDNPIIASEAIEHRYGKPVMPDSEYRFARCADCGTLYVDSDVTDAYLASVYEGEALDEGATDFQVSHEDIRQLRVPEFQRHWRRLRELRPPRPGDFLLDVGCQMGDFGAIAQADGVQPCGLELSAPYAEACRVRWGPAAIVHHGTFDTADFGRRFEYVTAFETLEHVCDPIAVLRQMAERLAPGGLLAISVPSSDYFHFKYWLLARSPAATLLKPILTRYRGLYARQILPHTHVYNFSHASVVRLFERAGLQTMHVSLTGWHGAAGTVLSGVGRALEALPTPRRVGFAPSLFAVARAPGS